MIFFGKDVGKGRKHLDDRVDGLWVGREKELPYNVGISGRKRSLGNEGEPASVDESCTSIAAKHPSENSSNVVTLMGTKTCYKKLEELKKIEIFLWIIVTFY